MRGAREKGAAGVSERRMKLNTFPYCEAILGYVRDYAITAVLKIETTTQTPS